MPLVEMGVEAREQVKGDDGVLHDAKATRADHPLVKYAELFTKNFDLIAERRSCIHHLREAGKAVVLARYLIEAEIVLEEAWFSPELVPSQRAAFPRVPQLWN